MDDERNTQILSGPGPETGPASHEPEPGPESQYLPVPAGQPASSPQSRTSSGEQAGAGSQIPPGPEPCAGTSGPGGANGSLDWTDLFRSIDGAVEADRAAAADDSAALNAWFADARAVTFAPRDAVETRTVADGRPFEVEPGSLLAAASCPACGYGLAGKPAVLALTGTGFGRTAVAVHKACAGGEPA